MHDLPFTTFLEALGRRRLAFSSGRRAYGEGSKFLQHLSGALFGEGIISAQTGAPAAEPEPLVEIVQVRLALNVLGTHSKVRFRAPDESDWLRPVGILRSRLANRHRRNNEDRTQAASPVRIVDTDARDILVVRVEVACTCWRTEGPAVAAAAAESSGCSASTAIDSFLDI